MTHYNGSIPDTATRPADWLAQAACHDHADAMFPENNEADIAEAKRICRPCPVQADCVLDAIRTGDNEHGIRGGLRPSERRAVAHQLAEQHGIQAAAPAPEPRPERTFQSLWDERAIPLDDGHMGWTGAVPVHLKGRYYTPRQIAFRVQRGRAPVGVVRRTCQVEGCVLPAHLADQAQRDARRRAAAKANA